MEPGGPSSRLGRTTLFKLNKNSFRISKKENKELRLALAFSARDSLPNTDRAQLFFQDLVSPSCPTWCPSPLPSGRKAGGQPTQSTVGGERKMLEVLCTRTQASPGHAPKTLTHMHKEESKTNVYCSTWCNKIDGSNRNLPQ